jgi:hypothetical protein
MREMPCLWHDCDAVLNCADTLAQHVALHALYVEPMTNSAVGYILIEHSRHSFDVTPRLSFIYACGGILHVNGTFRQEKNSSIMLQAPTSPLLCIAISTVTAVMFPVLHTPETELQVVMQAITTWLSLRSTPKCTATKPLSFQ